MEDKVIITGGALSLGLVASDKATIYNDNGFVEDLPSLNIGRWGHACGHYITDTTEGNKVSTLKLISSLVWSYHKSFY